MSDVTDAIRVYVVDDHPVVRQGLHTVLSAEPDIVVVGHAGNGDLAMCELVTTAVDVVVVDHQLGSGISGTRLLGLLCAPPYSLRCLVLTAAVVPAVVHELIGTGLTGVLSRSGDVDHMLAAVRSVAAAQSYDIHLALPPLVRR